MSDRKKLTSWKEISNYLDIKVRTAQYWEEKSGLPVHRIDNAQKSYVFAYTDEIDKWLEEKGQKSIPLKKSLSKRKKFIIPAAVLTCLFIAIIFLSIIFPRLKSSTPSNYKIQGNSLLIYNNSGKKLWSYDTGVELDKERYLFSISNLSATKSNESIDVLFKDIDNDGLINVVFAIQAKDNSNETVLCFNNAGKKLWSYRPGKEITYGNHSISSDFDIILLRAVDLDGDGLYEIIIVACHKIYFPCRVLVLNHRGKRLGEYWNSGHIGCVEFLDLDDDGFKEIILGGLNNDYQKACLILLDPRNINGASPQEKGSRYHSDELPAGTEKYYILFPQNEVSRLIGLYEKIPAIDVYENRRIQVSLYLSRIFFEFDYRLNPIFVLLGDEFKFKFNKLKQEEKINIPFSSFNAEEIKSEIIYWNGKNWTNKPTMTDFWKNFSSIASKNK